MKLTEQQQQENFNQQYCQELPAVQPQDDGIIRDKSGRPIGYIDEATGERKMVRQGERSWKSFWETVELETL